MSRFSPLLALLLALPTALSAQGSVPNPRLQASRAELEQTAKSGGPDAGTAAARLRDGDLFPGDRVIVAVINEAQLTDTFSVSAERTLLLPELAPLPVAGLLRAEVEAAVRAHVARYVRDASVTARPLIRIIVSGSVLRPGVLNVPADVLVSDLFDAAGGLAPDANLLKSQIRRDGAVVYDSKNLQRVIGSGLSVDRVGLRGGDQLDVAQRVPGGGATRILPWVGLVTGLVTAYALIAQ